MNSKIPLSQAIAEATSELKHTAKDCGIPIVLLCQLNRSSASEKRAPEMHDLRDSGGIEQDADAVLMLERAGDDEEGKDINIWVRKNRGGKAGNVKIEITANDTYTVFTEKEGERMNIPSPPPPWNHVETLNEVTRSPFDEPDFDNNFPF
jgi:replicative DNA helicase